MYAGVPTTLPEIVDGPGPQIRSRFARYRVRDPRTTIRPRFTRAGARTVSVRRVWLRQVLLAVPSEAPVDHDRLAELSNDHVRRLEITMDHAFAVRVADGVGDRDHMRQQRQPVAQRAALGEQLLERAALDELHHVVRIAIRPAAGLVDGDDAGVLEPSRDQRLANEPRFVPLVRAATTP